MPLGLRNPEWLWRPPQERKCSGRCLKRQVMAVWPHQHHPTPIHSQPDLCFPKSPHLRLPHPRAMDLGSNNNNHHHQLPTTNLGHPNNNQPRLPTTNLGHHNNNNNKSRPPTANLGNNQQLPTTPGYPNRNNNNNNRCPMTLEVCIGPPLSTRIHHPSVRRTWRLQPPNLGPTNPRGRPPPHRNNPVGRPNKILSAIIRCMHPNRVPERDLGSSYDVGKLSTTNTYAVSQLPQVNTPDRLLMQKPLASSLIVPAAFN